MTNGLDKIQPSDQNRVKTGEKVESLCNFITKFTYQVSENIHRRALTHGKHLHLNYECFRTCF